MLEFIKLPAVTFVLFSRQNAKNRLESSPAIVPEKLNPMRKSRERVAIERVFAAATIRYEIATRIGRT